MGEPVLTSTEFSTELEIQTGLRVDGHPLWASRFLISDPEACVATFQNTTEISNGEKFAEAAIKCWERGRDQLVAVGVNCLDPAWVTPLFLSLKAADPTVPFVAYPNSGEKYDTAAKKWTPCESQKSVADYLPEWLDMGIAYVGGCCRNSAKDLRDMKRALDAWKEGRN
uniref:Hcy-binding domain-containing protein n=1 Tax=Lygus hesperus TaxID=30085 RepID=A0A0K8SWH2_LYGHE